jgi:hypothetical protein
VIIFGVQEKNHEKPKDVEDAIGELCKTMGCNPVDFDFAVRLGKAQPGSNRPILMRFLRGREKQAFMELARVRLKGSKVFVNHDLTPQQRQEGKALRDFQAEYIGKHPSSKDRVKIRRGKVILENSNGVNDTLFPKDNPRKPSTSR